MAAIDWDDVIEVAAELTTSAVPAGLRTSILAHVNGNGIAVDVFDGEDGTDTKLARQYKAAHMAALITPAAGGGGSVAGPIIAETEGDLSRTYANLSVAGDDYSSTSYGRAFEMMCRMHAAGGWSP